MADDPLTRHATRMLHSAAYLATSDRVETAMSEKEEIDRLGNFKLWRYASNKRRHLVPLLLVHSLISRPTIYDLHPGVSLVEFLLEQGYDVFLVDWGEPRPTDTALDLDDYAGRLMRRAIDGVCEASGARDVSLLAYCLGGTLSLVYLGSEDDPRVTNLALLATPFRFRELGLFTAWSREGMIDIDRVTEAYGNLPPGYLVTVFKALKPASDIGKLFGLAKKIDDEGYVAVYKALDRWTADHIPMAGAVARRIVKDLLRDDRLEKGTLTANGRTVDLSRIRCNVLNCIGETDLIVPVAANADLLDRIGSDEKDTMRLAAGHMALLAGRDAARKLWPALHEWLAPRSV